MKLSSLTVSSSEYFLSKVKRLDGGSAMLQSHSGYSLSSFKGGSSPVLK